MSVVFVTIAVQCPPNSGSQQAITEKIVDQLVEGRNLLGVYGDPTKQYLFAPAKKVWDDQREFRIWKHRGEFR